MLRVFMSSLAPISMGMGGDPLKITLKNALKESMKAGTKPTTNVIKSLLSEIAYAEKDSSNTPIAVIIQRNIKKRTESALAFRQGGRPDLAILEDSERDLMTSFLPQQLSIDELERLVKDAILHVGATSVKELGQVMKRLNSVVDVSVAPRQLMSETAKRLLK